MVVAKDNIPILRKAGILGDQLSNAEYANGDDGLDALMAEEVPNYSIQDKEFAYAAIARGIFTISVRGEREVRRARVCRGEIDPSITPSSGLQIFLSEVHE